MHSSYKISNSSDSCPVSLGTPSVMRLHSDKRSEELKFYIQSSLTVRKLSARPEDIEDALLVEDTETLALEPHSFNLLATPVTRELLRAEEKSRARDLVRQEAQAVAMAVDSADSDAEPTVNTVRGDERRRVYGGMKPSKPNVRDPGKSGTVTNRMDQIRADSKQIFRRSQIEKQRVSSAVREGNLTEAAGGVSLPTNPIPASDLDLPPPLTIRSPPAKNPPVSGLNPLLQGLQPIPQASPRPTQRPVSGSPTKPGQVPGKPDLVSIQVPMAGADGSQTMQTINIPRSVLAGASDRPILLTVTPKNGINKGQKQIVVLTRNSAGQTSCHVRPPPGAPGAAGRTVISSGDSPTKSVQLSPRPAAPPQSLVNNSVIKRHPVVTNSRGVAQPQPKLPQAAAPVQQQQGQKSVVKGQIIQTSRGPVLVQGNRQILLGKNAIQNGKICINQSQIAALTGQAAQAQPSRVVASGGARPGQTTTRSVITGAQLQNMVASGQRIVSMGTNAGGQQVVRVINNPSQPTTPQRVQQTPAQNGSPGSPAQAGQGSTASLSRILSALHNRGLVSQQPNGKFYYVGDKTKSPVGISPGSALKLATSQGIAISAGNSVPGISRLNQQQQNSVQQQATPVIQQQKSTAAVAVAPAANLDSFMADSDMMMMATSMINSNGTAAEANSTPQPTSDGETFTYRDRSLPPGWWIKVNKKQVAEYQYQVENFFYSPEGAELKNHDNIPAYIAGQLSVDSIGHTPPISVAQMPWREELSELDKQLVPSLENLVTHQAVAGGIIKRSSNGDTGAIDKRFKPDNNVLLA